MVTCVTKKEPLSTISLKDVHITNKINHITKHLINNQPPDKKKIHNYEEYIKTIKPLNFENMTIEQANHPLILLNNQLNEEHETTLQYIKFKTEEIDNLN